MRGIGKTTYQIKNAPHGAFYVWPAEAKYIFHLIYDLRRMDLYIIDPDFILNYYWQRLYFPITVDHYCFESIDNVKFWDAIQEINIRARR